MSKALNDLFGPALDITLGATFQGLCKAVVSVRAKVQRWLHHPIHGTTG